MNPKIHKKDKLKPALLAALAEAKSSICLAIGWLADKGLFGLLEKKAIEGVSVKMILIEDAANQKRQADYQALKQKGAQLFWLSKAEQEKLIDHKFGIIDHKIVLTGNFNWGHLKTPQDMHLNIWDALPSLAQGFTEEFEYLMILNQLGKDEPRPNNSIGNLLKKLNVLKVLIGIGDTEFIHLRLEDLDADPIDEHLDNINEAILRQDFEKAHELLQNYIIAHQSLQACIEPPIENFKREIQRLEEEIASISQEYNETEKVIQEFSKLHSEALGELLQKILYQSKIKAEIETKLDADSKEKQEEFEEAKKDHEEYNESFEAAKKVPFKTLTPAQKKELKKLYRQTSLKCHPDRIVEDLAEEAEAIFVELNKAYKGNDLEKVKEISEQLKAGTMLSKSESITELKKLQSTINNLEQKLKDWLQKLDELKDLPTYQTISRIDDWDVYFTETKDILHDQLKRLVSFNETTMNTSPRLLE